MIAHSHELASKVELGVKRVSLGAALASVAMGALVRAGKELLEAGSFGFVSGAVSNRELEQLLTKGAGASA